MSSSNSRNSSQSGAPMSAMASSARDKFQDMMQAFDSAYQQHRGKESGNASVGTSLEKAWHTMFGSCTTLGPHSPSSDENEDAEDAHDFTGKRQPTTPTPAEPTELAGKQRSGAKKADYGEHIYAQLFFDDQIRAARAVKHVREKPPSPARTKRSTTYQAFPASSPKVSPSELAIPAASFDDGISAISAHTLEAMEKQLILPLHKQQNSLSLNKVRSQQSQKSQLTNSSPVSRQSKTSQSTPTTATSSFENLWARDEALYWQSQIQQDDQRKPRRSRGSPSSSKRSHHPHETLPIEWDPDRIGEVLMVPADAELAEI